MYNLGVFPNGIRQKYRIQNISLHNFKKVSYSSLCLFIYICLSVFVCLIQYYLKDIRNDVMVRSSFLPISLVFNDGKQQKPLDPINFLVHKMLNKNIGIVYLVSFVFYIHVFENDESLSFTHHL